MRNPEADLSDQELRQRVAQVLAADEQLMHYPLRIGVAGGFVHLGGKLSSLECYERVEELITHLTQWREIYLVVSGDMNVAYAVARDLSRGFRRHECRGTNDLSRGFRRHECRARMNCVTSVNKQNSRGKRGDQSHPSSKCSFTG